MTDPRRRLRLLLTGDGRTLADEGGRLPSLDLVLDDGETTLLASSRAMATVALTGPVLLCAVDQRPDADLDGAPRQAVILVPPPPATWTPPARLTWSAPADVKLDLPGPLADLASVLLAEVAGDASPPELRAAWSRPGWHEEATAWVDAALATADRPSATSVAQVRQWGISTVLRVETPEGRCWFKAAFPPFRQEAAITEWLAATRRGAVPSVIAADHERGWLLLEDLGDRTQADGIDATRAAIDRLVALQRDAAADVGELRALGAPDRRLDRLVADLRAALGSPVARELLDVSGADALAAGLTQAIERLDDVLPDGLVHGDFHPGNTAQTDGGMVLFDWSDAAIACPVVDVATWTWWYPADPDRVEHVWSCFEAAWEREHGAPVGSVDRCAALAVAGAYHLVSYVRILEGVEPWARFEHADGVTHFHELLSGASGGDDDDR